MVLMCSFFISYFQRFHVLVLVMLMYFILGFVVHVYADEIHTLENNETIYQISQKYNIPIEVLLNSNGINDPSHLPIGKKIHIPEPPRLLSDNLASSTTHRVMKGDTLYGIALQYNTDIKSLQVLNGLSESDVISPGQMLTVKYNDVTASAAVTIPALDNIREKASEIYVVAKGDTLYSIAETYDISIEYLRGLNNLDAADIIKPGRTLIISGVKEMVAVAYNNDAYSSKTTAFAYDKQVVPALNKGIMSAPVSAQLSMHEARKQIPKKKKPQLQAPPIIEKPSVTSTASSLLLDRATPFGIVSKQFPVKGTSYVLKTHSGVFIESDENSVVKAVASGVVLYIVPSHGTFRNVLVVQSKSGEIFVYGCQQNIMVRTGDFVAKGQVLGNVGIMPLAQKPVLYFAVFKKDKFINPKKFLL